MRITEKCPCGSSVTVDAGDVYARAVAKDWRENHKHAETAPPQVPVPTRQRIPLARRRA